MITSLLDTDLYKLTMQQAVLELYPNARVEYRFTNRKGDAFSRRFFDRLKREIEKMAQLELQPGEKEWLAATCPFFKPQYLGYLASYRFNPDEVRLELNDGQLELSIHGLWHRTILWEVPLLALISEVFFLTERTEWDGSGQQDRAREKAQRLQKGGCHWADFGSRRRRNGAIQDQLVAIHKEHAPHFVGTSNVHLAHKHGVKPIGTMAHEWIMAVSALEGLRHANRHALRAWHQVYQGSLGIALTDTYGTRAFFEDFDPVLTRLFDGVRQDSGDPFDFADKALEHYNKIKVPATTKTIVFSDSLDVEKAIRLQQHCEGKIGCSFGIGTHFTNDFLNSPALSIVIKLWSIDLFPLVKLSDDPGKAQGDPDAIRVARWTFDGAPLANPS